MAGFSPLHDPIIETPELGYSMYDNTVIDQADPSINNSISYPLPYLSYAVPP